MSGEGPGGQQKCLKSIRYSTSVEFSNGSRAPPWRQVLGDICYLLVVPLDGEELCITASTEGYFLNKVSHDKKKSIILFPLFFTQGMSSNGDIQYDRAGNVYSSLLALLKTKSTTFANNIIKQVFCYLYNFYQIGLCSNRNMPIYLVMSKRVVQYQMMLHKSP